MNQLRSFRLRLLLGAALGTVGLLVLGHLVAVLVLHWHPLRLNLGNVGFWSLFAFFVIAAYLLAPRIRSWVKRELMIVACVAAIILVGVSMLVLNVHWASDVLAGWCAGFAWAMLCWLVARLLQRRHVVSDDGA